MQRSPGPIERLKRSLKRWPGAYRSIHHTYYELLRVIETRIVGSRIHELVWKRERGMTPAEIAESLAHPHRKFLVGSIAKCAPFESVLEIGCNVGSNLFLLAKQFPTAKLYGIDINSHFIEAGKKWMSKVGVTNVELTLGKADALSQFPERSIDITFTDATLLYVGPDRIGRAFGEMKRVTRKALLFNEWNLDGSNSSGGSLWYYLHWVHDYRRLLEDHFPGDRIRVEKLPRDLWAQGGGWEEYGALVEVDL